MGSDIDQLCPACRLGFERPRFQALDTPRLIAQGRARLGMTVGAFARLVGVSRAAVQQWEKVGGRTPNPGRLARVAAVLGMSTAEILSGGPRPAARWTGRTVPLVSRVEAGGFANIDNFGAASGLEMVSVTVDVRKHTFALRVHGDSMQGPGGDSFPEGTVIVVEPAMQAEAGDFVVALNESKQATFKQLVLVDGVRWLKPLNKRFTTRPLGSARVIGVVREAIRRFR